MKTTVLCSLIMAFLFTACLDNGKRHTGTGLPVSPDLYRYTDDIEPRWISFENRTGEKGKGGMENNAAKGHPSDVIPAGETVTLLSTDGPGIINRIWITISDRSPKTLRGLVLNMYWDGQENPAVSVPFGDFFSVGLGRTAAFENALFANPEGRSFNSFIQMPFKKTARIEIENQLPYSISDIFYDIDLQLLKEWDESFMYFHSHWQRDTATVPGRDFEILPETEGRGRFLGTNVSVNANPLYMDYWWGEGEVKIYLNGDSIFPTLVGTGTEDFIGSAWGQNKFFNRYTGCSVADPEKLQWSFYRFHIPDPVYFSTDCRVTLQQIGGSRKGNVTELQKKNIPLIPVTIGGVNVYSPDSITDLSGPGLPGDEVWTNFYRSDDVSAVVYFYLSEPGDNFPEIQALQVRTYNLKD